MASVLKPRHAVIVTATAFAIIAVHYWNTHSRTKENAPLPVQTSDPEPVVATTPLEQTIEIDETEAFRAFESGFWDYSSGLELPGYVPFSGVVYLGSGFIKVSATDQWLGQPLPKRERELDSVFNLWRISVTPNTPVAVLISSEDNELYMEKGFQREFEVGKEVAQVEEAHSIPRTVTPTPDPRPPPRVVHQHSGTVANRFASPTVRLQGKVLSRLRKGAIVQADGIPSFSSYGNIHWVTGIIYVQEHNSLIATYRDAPISGEVAQAGEFRFEGNNNIIHVMKAWRFK